MNVALLCATGPEAPSFRVRGTLLREPLAAHGLNIEPMSLFDAAQAKRFAGGGLAARVAALRDARRDRLRRLRTDHALEVALILRQLDLLPTLQLERAAIVGRRFVYDVDDAIWLDARNAGGHPLAYLKGSRRKAAWLAERADEVVAATPLLAEWLGDHADRVTVIPSLVDTDRVLTRQVVDREEVVIGWIGSASTAPYLDALAPVLPQVARALPDRKLLLETVGGGAPDLDGVTVRAHAWSEDAERDLLARMDIGIMPIPDRPWTRGKAAYKALQYMAAGVPVVADPVGFAPTVLADGAAGVLPHDASGWVEALRELASDAGLRGRLGAAGRARVEAEYSVQRWTPTLAQVLSGRSQPCETPRGSG